eukprot:4547573-Amphidinium_carterae.2
MGAPLAIAVDISMVLSQIGFVCGEMLYFAKNFAGALHKLDFPYVPSVQVRGVLYPRNPIYNEPFLVKTIGKRCGTCGL